MRAFVNIVIEGEDKVYAFEGEVKELFRKDVTQIINASVPQVGVKFGDSGNVVHMQLKKYEE